MYVVTLNNNTLQMFGNIFKSFVDSGLNQSSSYEEFEKKAESFINLHPNVNSNDLSLILPFNISQYNFDSNFSESDKINFIVSFKNYLTALENVIDNYKPIDKKYEGMKRQVSPPYEEYHYVGHNELEITPTDSSYGLLFERD